MEGCSSTSAEIFKHYEPSPEQHHKKYHVFLSFRGADVRNTLVDHLFNSLSTEGFRVFPNMERLEKGKNIVVSQEDAIRNSTVLVPIFSDNYASSPPCLEELSLMWTCKSSCTETTIIPLFYNVKPSDVRYPDNKGLYAKAFQEHRAQGRHREMDAWREALHQVSLLSGWSLAETAAGYEGKLVKLVVMDLRKTLRINDLYVPKHLEGLSDRVEEVTTLLELNDRSRRVLSVGIWGMGGLGKTTLAKAIYNNIHLRFEGSCFVSDVRASTKDSVKGLLELQKQILRDLAKVNKSDLKKLNTVANAKIQMENLLRSIKALVILDDVDDEEQLNALIGDVFSGYWFGEGSRIIITTRDSQVWKRYRHSPVIQYSMRGLDPEESLKLFSWHAFMRPGPAEGYEDITMKIVGACQGLPLSLEVVGARLYSEKSLEIWREAMTNLVKSHKKLYTTLKISYDALSVDEKRMFLDIACFFLRPFCLPTLYLDGYSTSTRYDMEFYGKLWEALGCSAPRTCLRNLEMKSLIRRNYMRDHTFPFWMHDHIRDLGRQIIEEASPSSRAERSRFWNHKDLVTAMAQKQGMPNVEGLVLDFSAEEGLHQMYCSAYPWASMPNLKFMFISTLRFQEGRTNLPPNLIFLSLWCCWFKHTYPFSFRLTSSCWPMTIGELRSLRFLDMTGTNIHRLPNEVGELYNLEVLYLSFCRLRKLSQSLANLTNLKVLDISHTYISSFPARFRLPSSLIELRLQGCLELLKMPSMSHLKKLEVLDVSVCIRLKKLPSLDSMHSLRDLQLWRCQKLQALPALPNTQSRHDLGGCRKLQEASNISDMKKLEALNLSTSISLKELPSLDFMHSLRDLTLKGCEKLQALPVLPDTLSRLDVSRCSKLQDVSSISHLKKLENLEASGCTSLTELPSLDSMHSLRDLKLGDCRELLLGGCQLRALPALPDTLSYLSLSGSGQLQEVSSISHLKKLENLDLSRCKSLTELPSLESLHSLRVLDLRNCEKLQALPALPDALSRLNLSCCCKLREASSISLMEKLEALNICWCTSLTELPSLGSMQSLRDIKLWSCEELQALPALPDNFSFLNLRACRKLQEASSISHMKNLEVLDLCWCTSLRELPSLDSMHSLRDLKLQGCEELQALPALPDTLSRLDVSQCSKLQDMSSISHLKKLENFDVSECTSLTELPSLDSMYSLRVLRLWGCEELQALPALPDTLSDVDLRGCRKLQEASNKLQEASSISHMKKLKTSLHKFHRTFVVGLIAFFKRPQTRAL